MSFAGGAIIKHTLLHDWTTGQQQKFKTENVVLTATKVDVDLIERFFPCGKVHAEGQKDPQPG